MLTTILSTLGIPHAFAGDPAEPQWGSRYVYLAIDGRNDYLRDRIGGGAAAVTLPETGMDFPALDAWQQKLGQKAAYAAASSSPATRPAPLAWAFCLLSQTEARASSKRDEHDRFRWTHTALRPPDLALAPLVSEYSQLLLSKLKEGCLRAQIPMIRKEFWPGGRPMAACLTHDVDVVRRGKLPRGIAVRDLARVLSYGAHGRFRPAARQVAAIAKTASSRQDPYWTFDRISAIEREHGYRSTYFFMAGRYHAKDATYSLDQPRLARLLNVLVDSGCEVALHGSYVSLSDAELLKSQKRLLESHLGREVVGHRNHLLRFQAPDSWQAQENAGFSYDATLGFADHEGFRGGHAFPFHPYDTASNRELRLLEIPLAAMDVTLRRYRRLRPPEAEKATAALLEKTQSVNGLATLLWHNESFNELDYPGWAGVYESALAWLSEHGAYVATCQEIDRWWRAREATELVPFADGRTGWRMTVPLEIDGLVLDLLLPDPQAFPRVEGPAHAGYSRHGFSHLLLFGHLPAGSTVVISCQ